MKNPKIRVSLHFLTGVCPDIEIKLPFRINLGDEFIMDCFLPSAIMSNQTEEALYEFDTEIYECVSVMMNGDKKGVYQQIYLDRHKGNR